MIIYKLDFLFFLDVSHDFGVLSSGLYSSESFAIESANQKMIDLIISMESKIETEYLHKAKWKDKTLNFLKIEKEKLLTNPIQDIKELTRISNDILIKAKELSSHRAITGFFKKCNFLITEFVVNDMTLKEIDESERK